MQSIVDHGRAVITKGSESFAAAARLFPPDIRADVYMLYAWCRHCDDQTDHQRLGHDAARLAPAAAQARVDALRAATLDALAGESTTDPIFAGIQHVIATNRIPHRYPLELIDGFNMDVSGREYLTMTDTLEYCYHVAGAVGVMMAYIMGVRDEATLDRAADLGLAFQLTNICRDVVEDAMVGRVYLPRDWLTEAGITQGRLDDPRNLTAVFAAVERVLAVAERFYESSWIGISQLFPRSAWAVAAANAVYRDIGRSIIARGPEALMQRTTTGTARKLSLIIGAAPRSWAARTWGKGPADQPRGTLWTRPTREASS